MLKLKFSCKKYELGGMWRRGDSHMSTNLLEKSFSSAFRVNYSTLKFKEMLFFLKYCYLYTKLHSVTFQKTVILLRVWSSSVFVGAIFYREWCIYVHSKRIWNSLNCTYSYRYCSFRSVFHKRAYI